MAKKKAEKTAKKALKQEKIKKETKKKTKSRKKFAAAVLNDPVTVTDEELDRLLAPHYRKVQQEVERRENIYHTVYEGKYRDQKVNVDIVPFTEDVARKFLTVGALPGDRELHTRHLVDMMFSVESSAIMFVLAYAVLPCGRRIRLDGQHSLMVKLMYPDLIGSNARVSVCEYPVENEQEAVDLWTRFNKTVSTRTQKDVFRAEISFMPELSGVGIDTIDKLVAVTGKHQWGDKKYSGMAAEQRKWLIKENLPFFVFMTKLLKRCGKGGSINRDKLAKMPVLNVIYRGWLIDPDDCMTFWSTVISPMDFMPNSGMPYTCGALNIKLETTIVGGANQSSPYTKSRFETPDFLEALCSVCWNKWRKGSKAKTLPQTPYKQVYDRKLGHEVDHPLIEGLI